MATAPPTPSAARRVFAIPELLEHILLLLGSSTITTSALNQQQQHNPSKPLFVLQRVNTSFHHTIKTSTPLRRLMFLGHTHPQSTESTALLSNHADQHSDNLRALWWSIEQFDTPDNPMTMTQPRTRAREILLCHYHLPDDLFTALQKPACTIPPSSFTHSTTTSLLLHPHASWRAMKVFRAVPRDDDDEGVRIRCYNSGGDDEEEAIVSLTPDLTLGEFWDEYRTVVGRVDWFCGLGDLGG